MRKLLLLVPLVLAVGLGVLFNRGLSLDPEAMPSALIDQPLPNVSVSVLGESQQITLLDGVQGPALVNVWATWCVACLVEHPYLNTLAEQGVRIYGLNYKDETQKALVWLDEKGDPYTLSVEDPDGMLGLELGVTGAPETYLVDASGRIVLRHQGVVDAKVFNTKFSEVLGVTL